MGEKKRYRLKYYPESDSWLCWIVEGNAMLMWWSFPAWGTMDPVYTITLPNQNKS